MTRPETTKTVTATETYRGVELALVETFTPAWHEPAREYPAEHYNGRDHAAWTGPARDHADQTRRHVTIGARSSSRPTGTDTQVFAKLRKYVDLQIADEEVLPKVTALIANVKRSEDPPAAVALGDVVAIYAMGHWRRGLVTKVNKARVEVAYTTRSSGGRVFRKMEKPAELSTV